MLVWWSLALSTVFSHYNCSLLKTIMTNLNQNEMAEAVASGKSRYELDKVIGYQVILGVLFIACGGYSTIPVGADYSP